MHIIKRITVQYVPLDSCYDDLTLIRNTLWDAARQWLLSDPACAIDTLHQLHFYLQQFIFTFSGPVGAIYAVLHRRSHDKKLTCRAKRPNRWLSPGSLPKCDSTRLRLQPYHHPFKPIPRIFANFALLVVFRYADPQNGRIGQSSVHAVIHTHYIRSLGFRSFPKTVNL